MKTKKIKALTEELLAQLNRDEEINKENLHDYKSLISSQIDTLQDFLGDVRILEDSIRFKERLDDKLRKAGL
jgi:hypothetical protein